MTRPFAFALALFVLSCGRAGGADRPPRWTDQPTWGHSLRVVGSGEVARDLERNTTLAGGSLTVGVERRFSIHPWINEIFYGEAMGLELRGRLLRPTEGEERAPSGQVGAAFVSSVLVEGSSAFRRLRVPGLFPLLLPEIGATFRAGARPTPTLRFSAPVAYLVHRNVAVEVTPSATLVGPAPRERPDLFVGLGVGLSFRQVREPYFRDVGVYHLEYGSSGPGCRPLPVRRGRPSGRTLDLSAALPYRRYLAVTRVTPLAHYFRVASSHAGELLMRVFRRADGTFDVDFEPSGVPVELSTREPVLQPPPPGVASAARAYHEKHCGGRTGHPVYAGARRTVILEEFVLEARERRPGPLSGWYAKHVVAMNETLERVLHTADESGERARLSIPESARFLPSSGAPAWNVEAPSELPESLHAEIADVARRFDRGLPTTPLAELVPPGQRGIPRSLDPHVRLTVTLNVPIRGAPTSRSQAVELPLSLHDAVFGPGASGDGAASFGYGRFQVHAALSPSTPRAPVAGQRRERYQGFLIVKVEHERGGRFERWYPVDGELEVDGDGVLAPRGLRIAAPGREASPRVGTIPLGNGRGDADVAVHPGLPVLETE